MKFITHAGRLAKRELAQLRNISTWSRYRNDILIQKYGVILRVNAPNGSIFNISQAIHPYK